MKMSFALLRCALAVGMSVGAGLAAEPKAPPKRFPPGAAKKGGGRPDFWATTFKTDAFNARGIPGFRQETMTSRKLNFNGRPETTVGYSVYLPPGYETDRAQQYPVLYFLHGLGGNEGTAALVVAKAHEAITAKKLRPFIIAAPNGGRAFYGNQFEGRCQVHDFFFEEFLPHIEQRYRVKRERASRHLQGFSMGGYGALMYAAKHPGLFGAVTDIGGALQGARYNNFGEMYDSKEEHYRPFDLWRLAAQNQGSLRTMRIAIWIGSADIVRGSNEQFHAELTRLEIPHDYRSAAERPKLESVPHDLARYYELYGDEILAFHAEAFGQ
jgi:enterochelin esterase-like enzyme